MSVRHSPRIELHTAETTVWVRAGGATIARSDRALRLTERGYPDRWYLPHADVVAGVLEGSATRTHCPFKGEATYFHVRTGHTTLTDAAWSYEQPLEGVADIACHVAFDHPQLTLHFEEH